MEGSKSTPPLDRLKPATRKFIPVGFGEKARGSSSCASTRDASASRPGTMQPKQATAFERVRIPATVAQNRLDLLWVFGPRPNPLLERRSNCRVLCNGYRA